MYHIDVFKDYTRYPSILYYLIMSVLCTCTNYLPDVDFIGVFMKYLLNLNKNFISRIYKELIIELVKYTKELIIELVKYTKELISKLFEYTVQSILK
jgi:hypothetical protein